MIQLVLTLVILAILPRPVGAEPMEPRLVGPFEKEEYPPALIDRPLTLPAGMVEGELGASFISQRVDAEAIPSLNFVGTVGADDWDADVTLRVGVTDRIQVEAGTAFSLDHTPRHSAGLQGITALDFRPSFTSWRRVAVLRLSALALDTEMLDTAVRLTLPFVAHAQRKVFFGRGGTLLLRNSDGRVLPEVQLDAPTRWRLTDWLWLRAGENLFGVTTGEGVARFAFDLGVGIQPHPIFALTLDSRIASVEFDGSGHDASRTIEDVGTIDLEGVFAPCRAFDFVGSLGLPDVGQGFEDYVTRIAVRVRL